MKEEGALEEGGPRDLEEDGEEVGWGEGDRGSTAQEEDGWWTWVTTNQHRCHVPVMLSRGCVYNTPRAGSSGYLWTVAGIVPLY